MHAIPAYVQSAPTPGPGMGTFFVAVQAGPPRAGLPFLGCLATDVHLSCLKMRDLTARFLSAIYFQVLVLLSWNGGKISVMRKNAGRKLLN